MRLSNDIKRLCRRNSERLGNTMKTKTRNRFLLFAVMLIAAPCVASSENPAGPGVGLDVTTYAPGSGSTQFKSPTHIAFGPDNQEIVTDLKNSRFMYRDSPGGAVSTIAGVGTRPALGCLQPGRRAILRQRHGESSHYRLRRSLQ